MDWLLRRLADQLGVEPARAGEAITPQLRFEQPWSQGVTLLVVLGCAGAIIWLYRREGQLSLAARAALASLRIALVLLTVFMLSEAVLSVERTGLPYFVVMVDDSASAQIADQYANPRTKAVLAELTRPLEKGKGKGKEKEENQDGRDRGEPSRLAVARGWLNLDEAKVLRSLQKQNKVRL